MKKSSSFYVVVILLWLTLCAGFFYLTANSIVGMFRDSVMSLDIKIVAGVFLGFNAVCMALIWFNGVREIVVTFYYFCKRTRFKKHYDAIAKTMPKETPKVAILYCTRHDFDAQALKKSMKQNYGNFKVVILDDSTKEEYVKKVDKFAKHFGIEVFRRKERRGFKAGALNDWLFNHQDEYDFFAILDKDEIIPQNFCTEILKYFYYDSKIGAVQAFHSATQNENVFQDITSLELLGANAITYPVRDFYGANIILGHGAMVKKEAFLAVGGFPEVVCEDCAFSMQLLNKGYQVSYAPNVMCKEEYPIDYLAFKKRNCRWLEGEMENLKKLSKTFLKSKNARWFEKLDIWYCNMIATLSLPLLGFLIMFNMMILGVLKCSDYSYTFISSVIMVMSLLMPLVNCIFVNKSTQKWKVIPYFMESLLIYTSMLPAILYAEFSVVFGKKPYFVITSNSSNVFCVKDVIKHTWASFVFGAITFAVGILFCHSVFSVLTVGVACFFAPILLLLTNIKIKKKTVPIKNFFVDEPRALKSKHKEIRKVIKKALTKIQRKKVEKITFLKKYVN